MRYVFGEFRLSEKSVRCPRCGSEIGDKCRQTDGRTLQQPHMVRIKKFRERLQEKK